jgi:hypothetical protein
MDLEGYTAWEAHMVRVLTAKTDASPERVLDVLDADLARLQQWRPGGASLAAAVAGVNAERFAPAAAVTDAVVIRRYLAARAFASWAAYDRAGIAAVLGSLREALGILRGHRARLPLKEAIRQTDFEVMHRSVRPDPPAHHSNSATSGP